MNRFLQIAPAPRPQAAGALEIDPVTSPFSAVVFKVQANMDPRHRDRVAFLRVRSGRLDAGMAAVNARSGERVRLQAPRQFLAQDRHAVDAAWAGDVVGVQDRGALQVGDTLSPDGSILFSGIPRFAPEHFAQVQTPDPLRRKQLDTGLRHLAEEGLVQVLRADPSSAEGPRPIVAAVGPLQFDILLHRLEAEYGTTARLVRLSYCAARWAAGPADVIARIARAPGVMLLYDRLGRPVILFDTEWSLRMAANGEPDVTLLEVEP